jgi:DNA-binding response OmpR family regulator
MTKILKNYSILYVEDEPTIQQNICEYLESYFDEVYVASDGKKALELYYEHCPDVMLLDINLPYISGLDVAKEIRQENASVKIIMLTAYTDTEKLLTATELKLSKYLVKPIEPKLFKETMLNLSKELLANPLDFALVALNCIWHKKEEVLYLHNVPVDLSEKEHRLFKLLLAHKGSTVCYEDIMISVWEDAFDNEISLDSVKNQVSHLRKKLPKNCIKTVYGQGYMLR